MPVKSSAGVTTGRYVQGGTTTLGVGFLGWWERRIFSRSDEDVVFRISTKYHRRPDLLAFDVYGRASMMWVILQYNNIVDINEEFLEGKQILLPSQTRVQTEILSRS